MNFFINKLNYFFIILLTSEGIHSRRALKNLQSDSEYKIQKDDKNNIHFTNLVYQPDRNSPPLSPETPAVELIKRNGYPSEIYEVITDDGFILQMFRIPCGRIMECNNSTNSNVKPPVLALHPVGFTTDIWLYSSRVENALPFVLADSGYDVWLPNLRTTKYSNKHLFYDSSQVEYWNFSFDEYGTYDVRAIIEFILNKTGKPKLHFISYSGSAYPFFAAMAKYSYLNEKIALNVAFAPSSFQEKIPAIYKILASSVLGPLQIFHRSARGAFPSDRLSQLASKLLKVLCLPNLNTLGFCHAVLSAGGGGGNFSKELLLPIVGKGVNLPSMKVVVHFLQIVNVREFREFNYGAVGNRRMYGQSHSPKYDLQRITAPVALMQATNDALISNESMEKLARTLPNVVDYYVVPIKEFSHVDFCCGEHNTVLFSHTIKLLNRFS